jgi:hypothetical protein
MPPGANKVGALCRVLTPRARVRSPWSKGFEFVLHLAGVVAGGAGVLLGEEWQGEGGLKTPFLLRARLGRFFSLIQEVGFAALPRDSVKHLEDKLWELRVPA